MITLIRENKKKIKFMLNFYFFQNRDLEKHTQSKNHVIDEFSNSIFLKTNFLFIFIITFFIYFHM